MKIDFDWLKSELLMSEIVTFYIGKTTYGIVKESDSERWCFYENNAKTKVFSDFDSMMNSKLLFEKNLYELLCNEDYVYEFI